MKNPASHLMTAAGLANQHGETSVYVARKRKVGARHPVTPPDWPRVSHPINDNHCVNQVSVARRSQGEDFRTLSDLEGKLSFCRSCTFCCQASAKERIKSRCKTNKVCERCFLCRSVQCSPKCQKCPSFLLRICL